MRVEWFDDVEAFSARAEPFLVGDEARHNLMLGVLGTLRREPEIYVEHHLWAVAVDGDIACVALMTPPWNVIVACPDQTEAIPVLVDSISEEAIDVPGVTAAEPAAPGSSRRAQEPDRALVTRWIDAFGEEALHDSPAGRSLTSLIDARLSSDQGSGLWLWEDAGVPVALAGYGGATPNGIRVGPVFTPPEFRRRGYATSLVSEMSGWLLARGYRFCFLYTDLANETSNAIYRRIGYEHVADSADIRWRSA